MLRVQDVAMRLLELHFGDVETSIDQARCGLDC